VCIFCCYLKNSSLNNNGQFIMSQPHVRLRDCIIERLCCPVCKSKMNQTSYNFQCMNSLCQNFFPIVDGVPVLLDESSSVFSKQDFVNHSDTFFRTQNKLVKLAIKLMPKIGRNIKSRANYLKFSKLLTEENVNPKVLILGGGIEGQGMEEIMSLSAIEFIGSDVFFGPNTALICDAHAIPFDDRTFDGLIVQAVLEHVVDPYRCVEEIYRVLKDDGLVYAETPFIQQVHAGRYDFSRFTHLGHRRLFRRFEELCSGAVCGPGMALAWSYKYFLLSFVKTRLARSCVNAFASISAFWLKYFDSYLIDKPGALDAASGYYFMGRKSKEIISDRELIKLYRGGFG